MSKQTVIRPRKAIDPKDMWCLEDIYPSAEVWEADFSRVQEKIQELLKVEEALTPTPEGILSVLKAVMALSRLFNKLFSYARMRRDEDSRLPQSQGMVDRAESLGARVGAACAFLRPALLAMPEALLTRCIADPDFADYDRLLWDVLRSRPHTLPAEQEALLAEAEEIGGAPGNIYTLFTEADLSFPTIKGEDGKRVTVSDARFLTLLGSRDGRVRKDAYEAVMNAYGKFGNTFAAMYAASVKADLFDAKAHKFPTAIEAALFSSEIPVPVYDALITAIDDRLPALNRYQALKRKTLGLDTLHLWDLYADTAKDFSLKLTYDQAYDLVLEALAPLGADYVNVIRKAKEAGWVDVYENAGKHHGAYSWGNYDSHPYVLMNFEGTLDSASTLAHELGHAMHSYFSNAAQPYAKADYTLFAAEVASTVNEILLSCYLLEKHPELTAQQSLLGALLEHFRTTVFRQTLFATFEKETHAMQERGEALTREALCGLYYRINEKFYGQGAVVDQAVENEWMRIPHFYNAFYVYQYATGFSAAVCIARKILREGKAAVDGYMRFLSAGGSLPPLEALKLAGVDMATPVPMREALDWFEEVLMKFKQIC